MTAVPSQKDLWSRIERLERQVGNLQRQSTLSSASISGGNLTIRRGGSLRVIDGGSIVGEGGGNLNWDGNASFGGDTSIGGNLGITGTTTIGGNTSVTGSLTTSGDTTLGGTLEVTGDTEISGSLDVTGTTHIGSDLTIDGNTEILGNTYLGGTVTYGPGNRPPRIAADSANAADWQATDGATIVSLSIPRPDNYSNATVLAQASGFYQADIDIARACHPGFNLRIEGTDFQISRVPDNFSTYWIVGTFNREVSGSGPVEVSVRTILGPDCDLSAAEPTNRMYLGAVVVFTE